MTEYATYAFPAFRVFVFGVEITEDITSVTVNNSDDRAPSTARIVLANAGPEGRSEFDWSWEEESNGTRISGRNERYIVSAADIRALYDDITDEEMDTIATTPTRQAAVDPPADEADVSAVLAEFAATERELRYLQEVATFKEEESANIKEP